MSKTDEAPWCYNWTGYRRISGRGEVLSNYGANKVGLKLNWRLLQIYIDSLLTFYWLLLTYADSLLTSTDSLLTSADSLLTSTDSLPTSTDFYWVMKLITKHLKLWEVFHLYFVGSSLWLTLHKRRPNPLVMHYVNILCRHNMLTS